MPLKKIPVDTPGLFYYTLLPKKVKKSLQRKWTLAEL